MLTAGAYDQVFQALVPEFEKQTGHTVKSEKAPAGTLKKRIESGEAFDIAIITPAVIEGLIKDGKLDAQSYAKVATVGVGVGVREGAPKPDISSVEGFKRALIAAKAVAYTDPATGATSGTYVDNLLVRLGIADQVRPKAKLKRGGHAGDFVASGEADIVVQQASEIIPVKGVVLVGPLPVGNSKYDHLCGRHLIAKQSAGGGASVDQCAHIADRRRRAEIKRHGAGEIGIRWCRWL